MPLVRGVDEDTSAFDKVLDGMRMPRDTEQQRAERSQSMLEGYKIATRVPLGTVEQCRDALLLCREISVLADPEMISDAGTGALVAHAGAQAAAYNVRINLRHIDDADFNAEMRQEVTALVQECGELAAAVSAEVDKVLDGDTA